MSKVLTGTVQGSAEDRSFFLNGDILIDSEITVGRIDGNFQIKGDAYLGEFATVDNFTIKDDGDQGEFELIENKDSFSAMFFIKVFNHSQGLFVIKKASGCFEGLECGLIEAKFGIWQGGTQEWNWTFSPIKHKSVYESIAKEWINLLEGPEKMDVQNIWRKR